MKHFIVHVTTQMGEYEWGDMAVVRARNEQSARNKVDRLNWTHGETIRDGWVSCSETQEVGLAREIPATHFEILKQYLLVV